MIFAYSKFHIYQTIERECFFSKFQVLLKLFKQRQFNNAKYNIGIKANNFLVTSNNQIVNRNNNILLFQQNYKEVGTNCKYPTGKLYHLEILKYIENRIEIHKIKDLKSTNTF